MNRYGICRYVMHQAIANLTVARLKPEEECMPEPAIIDMTARVIAIESAGKFVDKKRRVTIRIDQADHMRQEIRFASDSLNLDDELLITMGNVPSASR